MKVYLPDQLPEVENVEILALGGRGPKKSVGGPALGDFPILSIIAASPNDVREIASLWRSLPPAEQMRCHVPPFGLRFFASGSILLEASLCWQCNNIWIRTKRQDLSYSFDGRAEISQRLYALLKRLTVESASVPPSVTTS